jgi:hypothetical protein
MTSKKPLHAYEQSMLLSALLFDSQNISEVLSLFPDEQRERMSLAKSKFLNLPKNERLTQIVLELRRLILIDENPLNWIHQTWIDDALEQEPLYLRNLIIESFKERTHKAVREHRRPPIPQAFIFSSFVHQLIKSPQKLAIFDPVLMRLQSLKNDAQEEIFSIIGRFFIIGLSETLDANRLDRYLMRKGFNLSLKNLRPLEFNPAKVPSIRLHFLRELIRLKEPVQSNGLVFLGLTITALYLSIYKYQWRRTIALVLNKKLGQLMEDLIERAKSINLDRSQHNLLSNFLLSALDQVRS